MLIPGFGVHVPRKKKHVLLPKSVSSPKESWDPSPFKQLIGQFLLHIHHRIQTSTGVALQHCVLTDMEHVAKPKKTEDWCPEPYHNWV